MRTPLRITMCWLLRTFGGLSLLFAYFGGSLGNLSNSFNAVITFVFLGLFLLASGAIVARPIG
jgi:hypothetical protein